jgi:hypothetical protein
VTLAAWLDRHTAAAPPVLRSRVREYALGGLAEGRAEGRAAGRAKGPDDRPADTPPAELLAHAGHRALDRVVAHPGDRSVALDLLAADALITLALLAQAETRPAELDAFAASLLQAARPGT